MLKRKLRVLARLCSYRSRPKATVVVCCVLASLVLYYRFIDYHLQRAVPENTPEVDFAARAALYREVCWKIGKDPTIQPMKVYYHLSSNISVCTVEKSGSTFWKRIFYFLYGVHDKSIKSPWGISRFYLHHEVQTTSKVKRDVYGLTNKAMFDQTVKVMFTRDPYTRLWSVYVDKFVLPDSWLDYGLGIVSHRKKDRNIRRNLTCADDVTFEEYIRFILRYARNNHWNPVYTVCNPCEFHPHYLGKMETFSRDSSHILKKVKLDYLIEGHGASNYAHDEVRMLTDYIFRLYNRRVKRLKPCLSLSGLAHRLWQAFVLNGYIDPDWIFPREEFSKLDSISDVMEAKPVAIDLLLRAVSSSRELTPKQLKAYRREVMARNFRALPRDLLEEVVFRYSVDFTLFDYNPRPVDIFPEQSTGHFKHPERR